MNRPERQLILAIGVPGTGKTVLTDRIADAMLLHRGYDSIFVADPLEQRSVELERHLGDLEQQLELLVDDELRIAEVGKRQGREAGLRARRLDGPLVRSLEEYSTCCALAGELHGREGRSVIPSRVIWRCGPDPAAYAPMIAEACDQGNIVLVLSESRLWYPNFRHQWPINEIPGRDDLTMEHLLTLGRAHIRNRSGERCAVHMILDSQDFMMLSPLVRKHCRTVLCGRLEGGEAFEIIRREFGDGTGELVRRVRELHDHEWIAVRGTMPELGPYRGGGR